MTVATPPTPHDEAAAMRAVALNPKAVLTLGKDAASAWIDDFAPSMGAAISYYTVFSIAPLLLIVIAIAGFVLGRDAASGKIFHELDGLMGPEGAAAIQGMVKSASSPGKGIIGTIIGVVTLLIGATTVFAELQSALDRIWKAPAATKSEGIWALVRTRFLSFGMILAIGFLLLVSLIVTAGLSAAGDLWAPLFVGWGVLLQVVNFVLSIVIVTAVFAVIYKWLPRATIGWRDVWVGAGVTAVLFTIGKSLIGLYIGRSGVVSGFGAAGSLVVLLVWVYYSAQIFLLGAEFTWLYAYRFGSRRHHENASAQQGNAPANKTIPSKASSQVATRAATSPARVGQPALGKVALGFGAALVTGAALERLSRPQSIGRFRRRDWTALFR
ncbi:MAG: YihY/virulence factor BrkB family protein [Betaproteobacteria bacterium]